MTIDAVIVGAGIAGLVAGLRLQQAGRATVIVERGARAGGLCATLDEGGLTFAVGCNEFGAGLVQMLGQLGVEASFHRPRARFHFGRTVVELPPNLRTAGALAIRLPQLARAAWGSRRVDTLGALIDGYVRDPFLADLACLPAFAVMRSPDDVGLASIRADLSPELGYGYDKSHTPVGGPRALVDAMVSRYQALGGTLRLNEAAQRVTPGDGGGHVVHTARGALRAANVLSSADLAGDRIGDGQSAKPGLEVGLVLLAVRCTHPLPAGLHTFDGFTPGVARMLRDLDAGVGVDAPSWHAICPDLPERDGRYALTVFVPLARGERDPPIARQERLIAHIRQAIDRWSPGFDGAVAWASFVTPDAYEARVGLRPRLSPWVRPVGVDKPPSLDPRTGVARLGTAVDPPGEHAGAAALSGWRAAERVLAPPPPPGGPP